MTDPRDFFAHRLALAMGRVNVEEMLDEISEYQFRKWMAFDLVHPFGSREERTQDALVAAALVNMQIAKGKGIDQSYFMPATKRAAEGERVTRPAEIIEEQSPELQIAFVRQLAAMHNSGVR